MTYVARSIQEFFQREDKIIGKRIVITKPRDKRYKAGDTFTVWKRECSPWNPGVYVKSDLSATGIIFLFYSEFKMEEGNYA